MLENFGHFGEVIKVQKLFTSTLLSKLGSNGDTYFLQSQPSKDGKTPKLQKGNFLKLGKPSCYEGIYQPKKNWYFSTRCIFAKCTQLRHLLSFIYNDKRYNIYPVCIPFFVADNCMVVIYCWLSSPPRTFPIVLTTKSVYLGDYIQCQPPIRTTQSCILWEPEWDRMWSLVVAQMCHFCAESKFWRQNVPRYR